MDFNKLNRGDLNNLQNQDLDFDKKAMWANLENRKERRPVFWWWGVGLGAALLLVGMFFYFNSDFEIKEKVSQVTDYQSNVVRDKMKNVEKEIENKELDLKSNFENGIASTKEKQITSNKKSAKFIDKEQLSRTQSAAEKQISEAPIFNSTNQNFEADSKKSTKIDTKKVVNQISKSTVSLSENSKFDSSQIALGLLPLLHNKKQFLEIGNNEKFDLKTIGNFKPKNFKKTNLLVSIFGGIGYQQRILATKGERINSEYLAARKNNETVLESWSAGLLIDKRINKKLQIGTGIELVQHNEKFLLKKYETNNIEAFTKEEIPSSFLNQNGFLTKTTENIYQNQIRLVNVPLSVSYLMETKNIRLTPTASVVFNLTQASMGHIENVQGEVTDMTPFFKSNIGLAYRFGCRIYYPLNTRYLLFANPQFEINPSDVSQSIGPISQKRNVLRLDIGVSTQIGF